MCEGLLLTEKIIRIEKKFKRRSLEVLNNEVVNYAKTKFIQNEDLFLKFIGFWRKTFELKRIEFHH